MNTPSTASNYVLISRRSEEQTRNGHLGQGLFSKANLIVGGAFLLLWSILIDELRIEWTANPQYSYGWVVPLLALGLLLRRLQFGLGRQLSLLRQPSASAGRLTSVFFALFLLCALLIFPLRLLLEATPGWRTANLLLALCTIGLTLLGMLRAMGRQWTWHFAFPVCFILVAVPWPHIIEVPLIRGLTQANTRLVIEVMGILGVPALQHGNIIEVSTGTFGMDEACSGIRSIQSSLMISLFLGEFYFLRFKLRLLLIPLGAFAAFVFNIGRTGLLTWLTAHEGTGAIGQYHDRAGISILLACTGVLWAIAWILHTREIKSADRVGGSAAAAPCLPASRFHDAAGRLQPLAWSLLVWLIVVQAAVELWYGAHESRSSNHPQWVLNWPPREKSFRELPIPPLSREMLAYDEAHCGSWEAPGGISWHMYYFRWFPGRLALFAARGHNPRVCLAAAGKELHHLDNDRYPIQLGPLVFPFRRYEYSEGGSLIHVFHCLWEDHAPGAYFDFNPNVSQLQLRLRATMEGRRNHGQRSLEFLVKGIEDPVEAQAALASELSKRITVAGVP